MENGRKIGHTPTETTGVQPDITAQARVNGLPLSGEITPLPTTRTLAQLRQECIEGGRGRILSADEARGILPEDQHIILQGARALAIDSTGNASLVGLE